MEKENRDNQKADKYRKIRQELCDEAWGKINRYAEPEEQDAVNLFADIETMMTFVMTNYLDAMIGMCEEFKFKEFIIFKPRKTPNENQQNGVMQGAVLLRQPDIEEKRPNKITDENPETDGSLPVGREFPPCEFNVNIKNVESAGDPLTKGQLISMKFTPKQLEVRHSQQARDENRLLTPNPDLHVEGRVPASFAESYLLVCYIKGFESSFVACYFKLDNILEEDLDNIQDLFASVSAVYLARWNSQMAEYRRKCSEINAQYIKHEISQILSGMRERSIQLSQKKTAAQAIDRKSILYHYPNLPPELQQYLNYVAVYEKNMKDYIYTTSSLMSRFNIFADIEGLDREWFNPYGRILYKLAVSVEDECKYKSCKIARIVDAQDPEKYPKIKGNVPELERAIGNLLNNAVKYSHVGSYIHLETEVTERGGKPIYVFKVTSYGVPFTQEENGEDGDGFIFQLGTRGSNAVDIDNVGKGFGLFIAKRIAEQHEGGIYATIRHISELHVPLLEVFFPSKETDEPLKKKCDEEIERLKDSGDYAKICTGSIKNNLLTRLAIQRLINQETARITFALWLPLK